MKTSPRLTCYEIIAWHRRIWRIDVTFLFDPIHHIYSPARHKISERPGPSRPPCRSSNVRQPCPHQSHTPWLWRLLQQHLPLRHPLDHPHGCRSGRAPTSPPVLSYPTRTAMWIARLLLTVGTRPSSRLGGQRLDSSRLRAG